MENSLSSEEIKSIKNKIKTLRPLIKNYEKDINDNQKQIDIAVNKYKKRKCLFVQVVVKNFIIKMIMSHMLIKVCLDVP